MVSFNVTTTLNGTINFNATLTATAENEVSETLPNYTITNGLDLFYKGGMYFGSPSQNPAGKN